MEQVNLPFAKMAPRRGLPVFDVTNPGQWVSTHAVCALAEDVRARLQSDDTAAWLSTISDPIALGPIYEQLRHVSTIGMLLNEYRRFYCRFRNYAKLTLMRRSNDIVIHRCVDEARTPHSELLELYALLEFVHVIRRLSGVCWTPTEIRLRRGSSELVRKLPEFASADVRFNSPASGIAVPIDLLVLPLRKLDVLPGTVSPNGQQMIGGVPLQLNDCAHALVSSLFADGYPEIELVAEAIGTSARTLQRQLAKEGLTYRELVESYRFEAARRLIEEGEYSFLTIALQLGYNEASSFSRAFRRWAGLSPSEYRAARALEPNTVA
jgi:AraC-like DNA-binding protein